MTDSGIYIYFDNEVIEAHEEIAYHQASDGRHYVELTDPIVSVNLADSPEPWQEFFARLDEWQATAGG